MSEPFVIGNCSPCCYAGQNEKQIVTAAVRFGRIGWRDDLPALVLPQVVYLSRDSYQADATGIFYRQKTTLDRQGNTISDISFDHRSEHDLGDLPVSDTYTYDSFGNLTKSVRAWPNGVEVVELSDPYTHAQAAADAVGLLATVDLLNPTRVYPLSSYIGGVLTRQNMTFCYPSEAAAFGGGNQVRSIIYVTRNLAGVAQISDIGFADAPFINTAEPLGRALNGQGNQDQAPGNPQVDGLVWARKSAARLPTSTPSRTDYLLLPRGGTANRLGKRVWGYNGAANQDYYVTMPLPGFTVLNINQSSGVTPLNPPLLPGEYVFTPSDVPGYGGSYSST